MTKKLAELLNLANDTTITEDPLPENTVEVTTTALSSLEKIEKALPQVKNLETDDNEIDELASMAIASYKDLMDLGTQVDSRYSSEIFSAAGTMLGHAITAKMAKINKKLKTVDLQLKTAVLEEKNNNSNKNAPQPTPVGEVRVLDRNQLLNSLLEKNQNNDKYN